VVESIIWYTGTEGQAEWVRTHCPALRKGSKIQRLGKSLKDAPDLVRPMMAVEQPDVLVTDLDGDPLISIEITEQQAFGLNYQQRMGRFWSAYLNRVPSAYLMPLESYQIEKASESDRRLLTRAEASGDWTYHDLSGIPGLSSAQIRKLDLDGYDSFLASIKVTKILGSLSNRTRRHVQNHILQAGKHFHLDAIPPEERFHDVNGTLYKAYLRTPGVPDSMVLSWFAKASEVIPSCVFKMQSDLRNLFLTNGIVHTLADMSEPHLSFRNLPPAPGHSRAVDKESNTDEIELFFEFIENAVARTPAVDKSRRWFTEPGEYFDESVKEEWICNASKSDAREFGKSQDRVFRSEEFVEIITENCKPRVVEPWVAKVLEGEQTVFTYRISCSAVRSMADPYSGALGTRRELLYSRGGGRPWNWDPGDYVPSAFWVDMSGSAAKSNSFFEARLRKFLDAPNNLTSLELARNLAESYDANEVPKDLRAHFLFSDFVMVRRRTSGYQELSVTPGLWALLRLGEVDRGCRFIRSLHVNK